MNRCHAVAFAFAALTLALSGCTKSVDGYAAAVSATAQHERTDIAAAPTAPTVIATAPPSVPSTGIPEIPNVDELVQWYVADLNRFWTKYELNPHAEAEPQSKPLTCPDAGDDVSAKDNAVHCPQYILYSPTGLEDEAAGHRYVVGEVIAHEVGHSIESALGGDRRIHAHELSADCLAGTYMAGKGVSLDVASDDFTLTEMYGYARGEALDAFMFGYRNFSPTDLSIEHVKRCIPKDH